MMNQETEKRTNQALRKLRTTLTKQGAELGLALNECEEASDDFELSGDELYQADGSVLVRLKIDPYKRRALVDGSTVDGAGILVHLIDGAYPQIHLRAGEGKLPYRTAYVHSS